MRLYVGCIGAIRVKTSSDGNFFIFDVTDSGSGIPPNELGSIFDKFHRVENMHSRSVEGSGIGLSLTLELVKAHGGKLEVSSNYGKGSTFIVRLPLGKDHLPRDQVVLSMNSTQATSSTKAYRDNMAEDLSLWNPNRTESESDYASGSNTGTNPASKPSSHEDLFPPLLFGDRERAKILLCDEYETTPYLPTSR